MQLIKKNLFCSQYTSRFSLKVYLYLIRQKPNYFHVTDFTKSNQIIH